MTSRGFDVVDPSFIQNDMLEKPFQRQVILMAEALGWKAYHHDTNLPPRLYDRDGRALQGYDRRGKPYSLLSRVRDMVGKGWPDLVLVRDGHLIFSELKSKDGTFTPDQEAWRALLEVAAAVNEYVRYFEWRPADINEIERVLT